MSEQMQPQIVQGGYASCFHGNPLYTNKGDFFFPSCGCKAPGYHFKRLANDWEQLHRRQQALTAAWKAAAEACWEAARLWERWDSQEPDVPFPGELMAEARRLTAVARELESAYAADNSPSKSKHGDEG